MGTTGYLFTGDMDELEISTTNRGADWIRLEYQTRRASVTCVNYGSAYPDWPYSAPVTFNTTSSGATSLRP